MSQTSEQLPPGQYWGKKWIIYAALGIPEVKIEDWRLGVTGLVNNTLQYSYQEFLSLPMKKCTRSFHCLLPDSMVYANPKPKEIKDLVVGDVIIGGDGKRHRVRKLIKKAHAGNVIGVKASYLPPSIMTPDHPVLTVRGDSGSGKSHSKRRQRTFHRGAATKWVRADELRSGDYVFFPKYRDTSSQRFISYRDTRFLIDERLAYILGWYTAEGSGADSDSRNVAFSLGSGEQDHVGRIRALLRELFGAKTSVYGNERGTLANVVVTSSKFREIARALKSWCGDNAQSKRIPDFILNANDEILRAFLTALFEGDGYSPEKTGKLARYNDMIDLTTSSTTLAYQLVLALSKLGIPAEIVDHPGSVNPAFSIRVRGRKIRNLLPAFPVFEKIDKFHYWETAEGFFYPIRRIWSENYSGEVYDFEAPGFTMLSPFVTQDCVTKWSIKNPEWEGVPIGLLAEKAGVKVGAKWVMFHCLDGYTAPVPIDDALHPDSIIALKLNGKPLLAQQGFPARPFIPHLYGWKSAKWLDGIEFLSDYQDGYWEMYGYHERGNVEEEERFKGGSGKHSKRRTFGVI